MTERLHEELSELTDRYVEERQAQGWRLAAVEWEREAPDRFEAGHPRREEVPYGLRISGDCFHLEENPREVECLTAIMELIVLDEPISRIAVAMNEKGLRDRLGQPWTPVSVYKLLPRLVEAGPHILSADDWADRRSRVLQKV